MKNEYINSTKIKLAQAEL